MYWEICSSLLTRRRQHYCGTFYRKRGTGCGRYLQSGHDIGHSVSEWSVHGREYSDRHVLRGERLRHSLSPDQYDYDFRICIFCNSNHSQYWNCEITSQIATGRRIYFGYDDFLPSHHICRYLCLHFYYNFFSSTLRALGDSNSPLYFLIISAILNVFGDLFFIIVLKAGSNGCAVSTVISEALCCIFCIIYVQKKVPLLQLGKKWLIFDRSLLKRTIAYGWASAMQQATVQLGKIGVQAIVNTMGVSVAAAFTAVNRIDDFAYTPEQNIAHAMTALMAQNKGAKRNDRMREGFRCGLVLESIYGILIFIVCFVFARHLMMLFVKDEEVIGHGVTYLHLISIIYILPAITNGLQGFFRGIGDLKITLISSFVNMGLRVLVAAPLVLVWGFGIEALPFSYLAGWIGMLVAELPLLIHTYRESKITG